MQTRLLSVAFSFCLSWVCQADQACFQLDLSDQIRLGKESQINQKGD
jgi:hypothetical protein